MKKAKIIIAAITFILGMAGCLFCSINSEAEEFLLRYAIVAGSIFACMFIIGIIVLFSTTGSDNEDVCNAGEMISLPFMYWGIMGAALIVIRIAIQRILATEETTQIVMVEPKLLVIALGIVIVVAAILLILIYWRTAVEDGIRVFAAVVGVTVIIVIIGAGVVAELNRRLDESVVDVSPTKPAITTTSPEYESEESYEAYR